MKVAIVSGVAGQDGAFLARLLINKGYSVVGLVPESRDSNFFRLQYLNIFDKILIKRINLLDEHSVNELMKELNPDEFYNLAAISSVGLSFKQPEHTFNFNTRSVLNILEAIRKFSQRTRFYQASSSEMFGDVGEASLPIKESFLFHPVSPYGISKASAHWLTVNYREAFKLKTCCGILFNHESALRPENFVIKKIICTAISIKEKKLNELTLGNMSVIRDWGYAPIYVEAMWLMMQQEKLEDYLICSGNPISLHEFVVKVFRTLNLDSEKYVKTDPELLRSLDLEIIYGDNSKAKESLGWEYSITTDELIERLIQDEINFKNWKADSLK